MSAGDTDRDGHPRGGPCSSVVNMSTRIERSEREAGATGTAGVWRHMRQWWPLLALILAVITIQAVVWRGYHALGHAAGHLSSASAVFGLAAMLSVIVWSAPRALRRRVELWVIAAIVIGASMQSTIANLRVVDAIGADDWSDEQAGVLGPARPGFRSGHDLAERAMWLVVVAAVVLTVWVWWRRAVSTGVATGAVLASVLFPPWIFAGAGLVVVAVAFVIARMRRLRAAPPTMT
jgi:hypothetical protein